MQMPSRDIPKAVFAPCCYFTTNFSEQQKTPVNKHLCCVTLEADTRFGDQYVSQLPVQVTCRLSLFGNVSGQFLWIDETPQLWSSIINQGACPHLGKGSYQGERRGNRRHRNCIPSCGFCPNNFIRASRFL